MDTFIETFPAYYPTFIQKCPTESSLVMKIWKKSSISFQLDWIACKADDEWILCIHGDGSTFCCSIFRSNIIVLLPRLLCWCIRRGKHSEGKMFIMLLRFRSITNCICQIFFLCCFSAYFGRSPENSHKVRYCFLNHLGLIKLTELDSSRFIHWVNVSSWWDKPSEPHLSVLIFYWADF